MPAKERPRLPSPFFLSVQADHLKREGPRVADEVQAFRDAVVTLVETYCADWDGDAERLALLEAVSLYACFSVQAGAPLPGHAYYLFEVLFPEVVAGRETSEVYPSTDNWPEQFGTWHLRPTLAMRLLAAYDDRPSLPALHIYSAKAMEAARAVERFVTYADEDGDRLSIFMFMLLSWIEMGQELTATD